MEISKFRFVTGCAVGIAVLSGPASAQVCNQSDMRLAIDAGNYILSASSYGLSNDIGRACAALKRAKPFVDQLNADKCGDHAYMISLYDRYDGQWGCSKVMKAPF